MLASGHLDGEAATVLCAQLLTLDAEGDGPVRLELQGLDAELPAALTVMGVLDVLRVPVTGYVAGQLGGPAIGVLAACAHRLAYPSAVLSLAEPRLNLDGTATEVSAQQEQVAAMLDTLYIRLAEVTGREVDEIRGDARRGRFLTVNEAVSYGLIEGQARGPAPGRAVTGRPRGAPPPRRPRSSGPTPRWPAAAAPGDPDLPGPGRHRAVGADRAGGPGRASAGGPDRMRPSRSSPPPFWAFPWAGGQALARYLLDHPGQVRGRTVLDFAAGSGLVAIAAARAGAAVVRAAETDPLAIAAIQLNASVNRVQVDAALGDLLDGPPPAVDLVLAGDVFYERGFARRLLPWLARVRAAGIEVLVGDPGRAYLPPDLGTEVAGYEVPVPRALEDADVKHSTVWQLR